MEAKKSLSALATASTPNLLSYCCSTNVHPPRYLYHSKLSAACISSPQSPTTVTEMVVYRLVTSGLRL